MSVKIFNPREPGYFPTSELKRFLLERRKPKPQESQQPIRRKENNFKSQLEFKVKPKFYIWLVEREALVFWTNHTAKLGKPNVILVYFQHLVENCSKLHS